ncbi:TniQ family protein [Streptomyces sp. AM8-1-1]|uniref:TniQ family protein n=1 Tax=Streptomyces sp. AM8-1-1 TaxID=3075825 RepID=UPI0028C37EE7|nr:TniQ family protein [Streptomyces sp. AM8-1-1]WNO76939.1 TniQ family protein [Streptomyces sp. AM8-1-1]
MHGGRLAARRVLLVAGESNASFLARVAALQGVSVDFLLGELGSGPPGQQALAPHLAEVFLSRAAVDRLAMMVGMSWPRLRRALPHLLEPHLQPGEQARWEWPWQPLPHYLVPACHLCAARRGAPEAVVWLVWPDGWTICRRHDRFTHVRQAGGDAVDVRRLPETVRAHRLRLRLERRWGSAGAFVSADAFAIVGWWWRHCLFGPLWQERARRAGLHPGDAETAWLLLYPEAVQVARLLLRHEQRRAVMPAAQWGRAESELVADCRELATAAGAPAGRWQVPVAEWLALHRRCVPPACMEGFTPGRSGPAPCVGAVVHQHSDERSALEDRCCLPWQWNDPSVPV